MCIPGMYFQKSRNKELFIEHCKNNACDFINQSEDANLRELDRSQPNAQIQQFWTDIKNFRKY